MSFDVTIVVPFLNEEENLENLARLISGFCHDHKQLSFEIILVNDGSTDNSVLKLKGLVFDNCSARLVSLSKNFGSHAALRAGISCSKGSVVVFYYADMQDPIEIIFEMYEKLIEGSKDIIWAQRNKSDIGIGEKLFSKGYARLMKRYAIPEFPEKGFDIVMFNDKVKKELNNNIEANSSIFLQILSLGFRQSSISYDRRKREMGKSKWTLSKKIKLFIDSFVSFSYAPIRMVTLVGLLFFTIGLFWTIYIIFRELLYSDLDSGWPTLISILMMGFGITNISLGVIAEYLWRTLDVSRKRSVFLVDEIIELNERG